MKKLSFDKKLAMIEKVINNMKLETVHAVMEFRDWKWFMCCDGDQAIFKVPEIKDLENRIRSLSLECFDHHENNPDEHRWSVMTGGFKVTTSNFDDEYGWTLECEFILSSWDCSEVEAGDL